MTWNIWKKIISKFKSVNKKVSGFHLLTSYVNTTLVHSLWLLWHLLTLLLQSTPVDRDFLSLRSSRVSKGPTKKTLKVLKAQVPLSRPCRSVAQQGQQQQQQLRSHHDDEFQTGSPNQDFPRHLCQDPCILLNHHGTHCNAPAGNSNLPLCSHIYSNISQDNMNPCIKKMQYAVRGPLVIRATEIEKVRWLLYESFSSSSLHNWYQKNLRPTLLNCRDRLSVQVQAQLLRFMELRCNLAARH